VMMEAQTPAGISPDDTSGEMSGNIPAMGPTPPGPGL
jgi:hypothetical protein